MTTSRRALLLGLAGACVAACSTGAPQAGGPAPATSAPAAPAEPTAVRIPQIAARSTLVRTGMLADGSPEVPPVTEPAQASWATWSPRPGDVGPAVLFGHVDGRVNGRSGVPGVFARIRELRPGNLVLVDRALDVVAFEVTQVRSWPKSELDDPTSAVTRQVYGDVAGPELRLVTCGGSFDKAVRSYRDQVVVFARLVQASP